MVMVFLTFSELFILFLPLADQKFKENILKKNIVHKFLEFVKKSSIISKDEWTSGIHFIQFLVKSKFKNEYHIEFGKFDCWPKSFYQFANQVKNLTTNI